MGIFTTNLKNVKRCLLKIHFFAEISTCPSTHQCNNDLHLHRWGFGVSRLGGMLRSRWLWAVQNWDIPEKCSHGDSCRQVLSSVLSDSAELENLMFFLRGKFVSLISFDPFTNLDDAYLVLLECAMCLTTSWLHLTYLLRLGRCAKEPSEVVRQDRFAGDQMVNLNPLEFRSSVIEPISNTMSKQQKQVSYPFSMTNFPEG